ncbi:nuclear transport factor 2 family protein [Singulisphaera sp. Ch08]|uniref:Nuclear transport factor 2 family protein n=1 Tax=Singulisphaera sp. Ch08 TaxID=3120278 RepID=A0AAU7CLL9_9BACT
MDRDEQVIHQLYNSFNARDMEGVFALLTDDVAWANGMEGTYVHGKDAIRDYWTHQWSVIDPHVEPLTIAKAADGSLVVDVHQVVKNLEGQTLIDETVKHAFRLHCGRVQRFDIQSDTQLTGIHSAT